MRLWRDYLLSAAFYGSHVGGALLFIWLVSCGHPEEHRCREPLLDGGCELGGLEGGCFEAKDCRDREPRPPE